jgi:hypothetical protein
MKLFQIIKFLIVLSTILIVCIKNGPSVYADLNDDANFCAQKSFQLEIEKFSNYLKKIDINSLGDSQSIEVSLSKVSAKIQYWQRGDAQFTGTAHLAIDSVESSSKDIQVKKSSNNKMIITRVGYNDTGINYVKVSLRVSCRLQVIQKNSLGIWVNGGTSAGGDIVLPVMVSYNLVVNPGIIKSKDAIFVLGETWGALEQSRLFEYARENDGTNVPYSSLAIQPSFPLSITKAINNENRRIDSLFNDNITMNFASKTGKSSSVSKGTVKYGNSIVLQGAEFPTGRDAAGVFALLNNNASPIVVATSGGTYDNKNIHDYFSGDHYVEVDYYNMMNKTELDILDSSKIDFKINGDGDTKKQDFLNQWGVDRVLSVNYGDIVRTKEAEGKIGYTQDSTYTMLDSYLEPKEIFFEVTPKGYSPLMINQLTSKSITVPYGASKLDLNKQLINTIDTGSNSNILIEKFTQYPDTTVSGYQVAKVLVSQTLSTGKKIKCVYTVPIKVENDGTLTFKELPSNLIFGEYQLGSQSAKLYWQGDKDIIVSDNRKINDGWTLEVRIVDESANDFDNYVSWVSPEDNSETNLKDWGTSIYKSINKGETNITKMWNKNHVGLVIDYSKASSIREDSANFEWVLLPTQNGVTP